MLNLSGLLGRGFDNIFDIQVFPVVLTLLLYTVLIPANYSGESPGEVQAISWFNLLFYITLVFLKHLWVASGGDFILVALLNHR